MAKNKLSPENAAKINALAEEIAIELAANKIAKKLARERERAIKYGACTLCASPLTAELSPVTHYTKCTNPDCCAIHINGALRHTFPQFARGKGNYFRKGLSLMLGIKG